MVLDTGSFKMYFVAIAALTLAANNVQAVSPPSVCQAVEDACNIAAQTCLEADDTCGNAWTAYKRKASRENKATDCNSDSTKTCDPDLASAVEMYTSRSTDAIFEAIDDTSADEDRATILACFKDSPDVPGCMMRELYNVDFNDESKAESFWASTTCDTNPDTLFMTELMLGVSCQPGACVNISACYLCNPSPAAPGDPTTAGGSGEGDTSGAQYVELRIVAIAFAACAALF